MKKILFVGWFLICFIPAVGQYNSEKNQFFVKVAFAQNFSNNRNVSFAEGYGVYYSNKWLQSKPDDPQAPKKKDIKISDFFGELFISISMFEAHVGLATTYSQEHFYLIPKMGVVLRPLYYGKLGLQISSQSMSIQPGLCIPIKDYQLELLYHYQIVVFKQAIIEPDTHGLSVGLQIPLYIATNRTPEKKLF